MDEFKILLIDDDETVRETLTEFLKRTGYFVISAETAERALEQLNVLKFECVISDNKLPGISGLELLRRVKSLSPDSMRLLTTGYADVNILENAINEGEIFRFLKKPVNFMQLKNVLNQAKEFYFLERQNKDLMEKLEEKLEITNRELKESEELNRLTLDNISDAVFITDDDGGIKYICGDIKYNFGYTIEEVKNFNSFQDFIGTFPCKTDKLNVSGELKNMECEITDKAGVKRSMLINVKKVSIMDGTILYSFRDITEKKKAEQERTAAVKLAERASRLASLGNLAGGISHEINQPLTALKLEVDGMLYFPEKEQNPLDEEFKESLEFIAEQTNRIDKIIKHMRSLAKQEKEIKTIPVNLNNIISDSVTFIKQKLVGHQVRVELDLKDTLPPVLASISPMEQVILNLIVNAIHAHDTHNIDKKQIVISTGFSGKFCLIEVSDNGPGIPESECGKIFDPFFSTKSSGEGMGLGLSITQNIISGFGGTISAGNIPDGGAVFSVKLPAVIDEKGED